MSMITIISLAIATAIPLISLYIIYTRDLYSTGSKYVIAGSFIWGGVAFVIAAQINGYLLDTAGVDWLTVVRFIAPIEEEILKGVILLYLVRRREFTNFVDGAIYGFAIGIGFAVVENIDYLLWTDQGSQLLVAVVRVISTNLMHAAGSAIIGVAMGRSRFSKRTGQMLFALGGLLVSGTLHVIFNSVSNSPISSTIILIITITLIGLISYAVIFDQIRRGLRDSRAAIEEKLGMADRVTAGETKAVLSLESIDEILEPLAMQFGPEKAEHIEKLLKKQARLGILRKNDEKMQDPALLAQNKKEMETVRADMEELRNAIGSYAMLFLRGVFPEEDSPLWGQLENVIAERIAASPGTQSGGLWDTLNQKAKPSSNPESSEE
jgi:RsiW-degrading membrane proteinase PrsW (M82 family)